MLTIAKPRYLRWQKRPCGLSFPFLASRRLSSATSWPPRETETDSTTTLINYPIEEELLPGGEYRLRWFHPTRPGEMLRGRFKTIAKLGFGAGSTVWLAENVKLRWKTNSLPRFVCIKIAALDTDASGEMERSELIAFAKPTHEGLAFLRTPIDAFRLRGPEGTHSYIKDDNIMVSIEKDAVLTDFVCGLLMKPQPGHVRSKDGRVTHVSQSDLGPLRGTRLLPELADFDLSFPGLAGDSSHLSAIQSHRFRAPEVLLGCAWSYSVDIWNLGLLMWNLLEDVSLFERPAGSDGEYDAHVHLAQMVSLLGDPPRELIRRERALRNHQLERPVINPRGNECNTMNEFWGGPFFDDDDQVFRRELVDRDGGKKLPDTVSELAGDEKETFLDFASGMLQWLPEKRKTAKELLQHPFFDSLYKDRERDIEARRSRHT
ncbi:Serine/threonine-protein kinase AFC3 [Tolypocladium ophioglossoides CBS 100239]|uniref:Serine/threonine-protein kinase AFC3 n=1 Tax=Tolypocladium ophioglossoides (strain CBS 100239) TaxID=1163406 RepID=A0A0L0NIW8_TOLOC|nr:Serine/threonine-protein kinase AFC3 [Tolypocladium ophioglossoides CBS 100239]